MVRPVISKSQPLWHVPLMTPLEALPEHGPAPKSNETVLPLTVPLELPKSQLALNEHPLCVTLQVPLEHEPETVPEPLIWTQLPAPPFVPDEELLQPRRTRANAMTVFMRAESRPPRADWQCDLVYVARSSSPSASPL
jgi:hypothetical protein